jgi:hypothetical protein
MAHLPVSVLGAVGAVQGERRPARGARRMQRFGELCGLVREGAGGEAIDRVPRARTPRFDRQDARDLILAAVADQRVGRPREIIRMTTVC